MQTVQRTEFSELKQLGRRVGYAIAIGIHLVLLYVVINLEEWDFLSFLTDEFGEVVPWISASLIVGIVAFAAYIAYDDATLRAIGEIVTNLFTIAVTWKVWTVFPFDFSAYEFSWEVLLGFLFGVTILGAAIGAITKTIELLRGSINEKGETDAHGI